MSQRLVKIAKELNVGTTTIVEYLNTHGFEIEDKPSAKITEEMYNHLLREFQKDRVIKEQADQLIFGTRPSVKKEATTTTLKIDKTVVTKEDFSKTTTEDKKDTPVIEERPRLLGSRLKIIGKIDLDAKSKKPEEEKVIKEEPPLTVVEPPLQDKIVPEPKIPPAEPKELEKPETKNIPTTQLDEIKQEPTTQSPPTGEPEHFRAETPELRGLKILGKIDTDRFAKKPAKKEEKTPQERGSNNNNRRDYNRDRNKDRPQSAPSDKPAQTNESQQDAQKKKRKRKKVTNTNNSNQGQQPQQQNRPRDDRRDPRDSRGGSGGDRGGNRRPPIDESKEVSKREIEDQIKATMARLSGGGKKKRQKMRRDNRERIRERQELLEQEGQSGKLEVTEFVSVSELASLMDVPVAEVITACLNLGVIVSINQRLDAEIIELIAEEFGHEVEFISVEEQTDEEIEIIDDPADLKPRAPIVTVMGHVDHGKTSLLDYIRSANVVKGEAGGITQHIGAYEVVVNGKKITFLDTPGHEAFTAMRARGAKITDIAVIVIAADDSIMPQTREAISHAQAANVPIVFAINKIDKPGAQPEKIKQELANMNFLVEEWGGKYQSQDISAKTGLNIDLLLEKILLEAEILDLKANPDRLAVGTVIEASLDKGRGYVAKILVQNGSLDVGDPIVAGEYSGKIKAMFNERGKRVQIAGPSTPVLVLGLSGAPQAGERFKEVENDQEARQIASKRAQIAREQLNRATKRISLDEIGRRLALGNFKELNLIVKGDVDGSVEALSDSLIKLSIEKVQVNVIHRAVGAITESDVLLASASDAIIVGFQVRPSVNARKLAEKEGVQIKLYSIIYQAIEEIKMAIEGMLEPTKEEKIVAQVEVREVFKISKIGTIAGCYVQEGKISRNTNVRVIRDGIVVYPTREGATAKISSLKRFKEDVKEVKNGLECGITIENYNDIRVGDIIEGVEIIEIKQKLA